MASFVLTVKAKSDLLRIGRYSASRCGHDQRNRYLAQLDLGFHELTANRMRGRDCGSIRAGYRKHRAGQHIIFYRSLTDESIEIVRVLHQRMDIDAHLDSEDD